MKIFKISYRDKFNILSQDICRQVFEDLIRNNYSNRNYNLDFFEKDIVEKLKSIGVIYLLIKINNTIIYDNNIDTKNNYFTIEGYTVKYEASPLQVGTTIVIELFSNIFDKNNNYHRNKLYTSFVNSIRHEIYHCFDFSKKENNTFLYNYGIQLEEKINNAETYFINDSEQNAFIHGIVLEAKKIKKNNKSINIVEVIKSIINKTIENYIFGINKSNIDFFLNMINNNKKLEEKLISCKNKILYSYINIIKSKYPEIGKLI